MNFTTGPLSILQTAVRNHCGGDMAASVLVGCGNWWLDLVMVRA